MLAVQQKQTAKIITWDPPDFAVEWDKKLLDIWGGSAAPYALTAGAINALLSREGALHARQINLLQTMNVSAWKTNDARIHLMFGNLEEGLRDDGDADRHVAVMLPAGWQRLHWHALWPDGKSDQSGNRFTTWLGPAKSAQFVTK